MRTARIPALALFLAATALGSLQGQERPRVAVLDFQNQTTWWENDLGPAASTLLATRLVQTGAYSVIERDQLDAILEEQGLEHSGIVDPEQAVAIGRVAGVHYIILGAVSRFNIERRRIGIGGLGADITEAESALNVRVVSTESAEIVAAAEAKGKKRLISGSGGEVIVTTSAAMTMDVARQALEPALDDLIEELAKQSDRMAVFEVEPELAPAAVVGSGAGGAVYVNRGENAEVRVGDRFAVLRVVDEIVDAAGNVLDQVTEQVAVLEVTRVLGQSAICRVVEGAAPKEGDRVEPLSGGAA